MGSEICSWVSSRTVSAPRNWASLIIADVNQFTWKKEREGGEKRKKRERCRRTGNRRSHGRRPSSSSLSEIRAIRRGTVQTSVTTPFPLNGGVVGSEVRRAGNVLKRALLKSGLTLDYLDCRPSCAAALNRRLSCTAAVLSSRSASPAESRRNKSRRRGGGREEGVWQVLHVPHPREVAWLPMLAIKKHTLRFALSSSINPPGSRLYLSRNAFAIPCRRYVYIPNSIIHSLFYFSVRDSLRNISTACIICVKKCVDKQV